MNTTTTNATKFEVGKTYACRSICDSDCIFSFTVISRTAKRITLEMHWDRTIVVRGIKTYEDGIEWCEPCGRYSMSPVIRADRELY